MTSKQINEYLKAEFVEKFTEYKQYCELHGGKVDQYYITMDRGTCFGKMLEVQAIAYKLGTKQLQKFMQTELDNYYKTF